MRESRLPIRIVCPGTERAERLVSSLNGFNATVVENGRSPEVHVLLDAETSSRLVDLFNSIGTWVAEARAESCQVFFGDHPYTLLAVDGDPNDPTRFLLERTIQLQTALDTRIVIEQAKGILAERYGLDVADAFELLRTSARSSGRKIHDLARAVVSSKETPAEVQRSQTAAQQLCSIDSSPARAPPHHNPRRGSRWPSRYESRHRAQTSRTR